MASSSYSSSSSSITPSFIPSTATNDTASSTPWQLPELKQRSSKRSSASSLGLHPVASPYQPFPLACETGRTHQPRTSLASVPSKADGIKSNADQIATLPRGSRAMAGLNSSSARNRDGRPDRNDDATSMREAGNDQWWESVLPPGQLAERLRRAQASSASTVPLFPSSSSAPYLVEPLATDGQGPRHSRKSILRSSTVEHAPLRPSLFLTTGNEADNSSYLCPPPASSKRTRAGTWSSHSSSIASHPTSSTRSSISIGDGSSASSSNDESTTERRSPLFDEWGSYNFGDRGSRTTSPTNVTRSQTSRRRRVVESEDGTGLGVKMRGTKKGNVVDLDERLRIWNSSLSLNPSAASQYGDPVAPAAFNTSVPLDLRPFPSSRYTPEVSSDEDRLHASRASSTRTSDTLRDMHGTRNVARTSAPSSRRSSMTVGAHAAAHAQYPNRRVSFNQDVEVVQANDVKRTQTIGRAHGRAVSSITDQHGYSVGTAEQDSRSAQCFPSHANRAMVRDQDVKAKLHSRICGKRLPCHSAPTSPQMGTHPLSRERGRSRLATGSMHNASRSSSKDEDNFAPEAHLAALTTLVGGHAQFASARNLAFSLTRQLSVPIRPVLHLTLLASISGMAFVALAGFLIAGYVCTVWDDVNSRGKSLQKNVSSARETIESRVQWTRFVLGAGSDEEGKAGNGNSKPTATRAPMPSARQHRRNASQMTFKVFTAPIRFALALPATLLYNITPASVRKAFASPSTSDMQSSSGRGRAGGSAQRSSPAASAAADGANHRGLPPRPPLSSLLPSIAFTIVIAFGAGLANFFASRAADRSSHGPARTTSNSAPSSPPLHNGRTSVSSQLPSATAPTHIRRRSAQPSLRDGVHLDGGRRSPLTWHDITA